MNSELRTKLIVCFISFTTAYPVFGSLTLYDDFTGWSGTNAPKWDEITLGTGRVYYTNGQVYLDSSTPAAGKISQLLANQLTFQFIQPGDSFRVTWDMQIVKDDFYSFGGGVAVGRQGGSLITAGQSGRENEDPVFGAHRNFFPFISPEQDVDRGTNAYHFDLRITMISTNGEVRGLMLVYAQNPLLAATPEAYATNDSPVQITDFPGRFDLPSEQGLLFYVRRPVKDDPDCCAQARGTFSVDNVFTDFQPASSLTLTNISGTSIYTAVEVCWPTTANKLYKVQWVPEIEGTNWVDFGGIYVGTGGASCIFDTTRNTTRRYYRVMELQ